MYKLNPQFIPIMQPEDCLISKQPSQSISTDSDTSHVDEEFTHQKIVNFNTAVDEILGMAEEEGRRKKKEII